MNIAILIFDKLTALDAIGPYEVLSRLPGAELRFVAKEPGPKRTDTGALELTADAALTELEAPDVVLVPGGEGNRPLLRDEEVLEWIRGADATSTWTTSVCTGSLVLGAAGVLEGKRATSHWAYRERLREFGAEPVAERYVIDGKVATAAGVSAGIDMALALAREIAGEEVAKAIQLGIEYDPAPPLDAGSPEKAGEDLVNLIRALEAEGEALEQGAAGA
jgi:transcriptional regulator GlxA family with amidase domain